MRMEKQLDSPQMAVAFLTDLLAFILDEWDRMEAENPTLSVEFNLTEEAEE